MANKAASVVTYFRMSAAFRDQVEKAAAEQGQNLSDFIREAVKEKLQRDRSNEALIKSLQNVDKRLAGLRSVQKMNFAAVVSAAKMLIVCLREPSGEALRDAMNLSYKRERVFRQSIIEEYQGDSGRTLDQQLEQRDERAVATAV